MILTKKKRENDQHAVHRIILLTMRSSDSTGAVLQFVFLRIITLIILILKYFWLNYYYRIMASKLIQFKKIFLKFILKKNYLTIVIVRIATQLQLNRRDPCYLLTCYLSMELYAFSRFFHSRVYVCVDQQLDHIGHFWSSFDRVSFMSSFICRLNCRL